MSENGRYKLNKELAQMLKGGVIMDVTTPVRLRSQKLQELVLLWLWNGFRQIFVPQAVCHV